jgi:hypothetical protein
VSDDVFVTGPQRVDHPHPGLPEALTDLWGRATVVGESLGFHPDDTVEAVRAAAIEVVGEVTDRDASLLILGREHALVGAALLRQREPASGELVFLTVDPEIAGAGWEGQLYESVLAQARALGMETVRISAPDGRRVSGFHEVPGWSASQSQGEIVLARS